MDMFNRGMVGNLFGLGRQHNFSSLLSMKPLSTAEQTHMTKVYATLTAGVLSAAVGAHIASYTFQLPLLLCALGQMGCAIYIGFTSNTMKVSDPKRLGAFGLASFLSGASLAPLLSVAHFIDPAIVTHAFFGTLAIFVCFSLSAMFAKERSRMFLGSILSSAMFYMSLISLFNLFFRTKMAHDILIYGGLIVFIGYVFYHTQETLQAVANGDRDFVVHALRLYLTLVGIFVRIVIILMEREGEKSRNDRSKRRRE